MFHEILFLWISIEQMLQVVIMSEIVRTWVFLAQYNIFWVFWSLQCSKLDYAGFAKSFLFYPCFPSQAPLHWVTSTPPCGEVGTPSLNHTVGITTRVAPHRLIRSSWMTSHDRQRLDIQIMANWLLQFKHYYYTKSDNFCPSDSSFGYHFHVSSRTKALGLQ
jgi:hypothetical protein